MAYVSNIEQNGTFKNFKQSRCKSFVDSILWIEDTSDSTESNVFFFKKLCPGFQTLVALFVLLRTAMGKHKPIAFHQGMHLFLENKEGA